MSIENILTEELTEDNVRVVAQFIFDKQIGANRVNGVEKTRVPGEGKSLTGVYLLIKKVIDDLEKRAGTPEENKVLFTEEEPDLKAVTEVITFSLVKREPGAYGQGAPFESKVKNMRPMLREEVDDPENPGYRIATTGYWHDNLIRLTCWAQTNKAANARAEWLENLIDEYAWYFKAEGVDRFLFSSRNSDIIKGTGNNRWYGRPIDYFVRTETLRSFSERKIQEILLTIVTKQEY